LGIIGPMNTTYQIQRNLSLTGTNWETCASFTITNTGVNHVLNFPPLVPPNAYYRALLPR
jgi:hypothetical protein